MDCHKHSHIHGALHDTDGHTDCLEYHLVCAFPDPYNDTDRDKHCMECHQYGDKHGAFNDTECCAGCLECHDLLDEIRQEMGWKLFDEWMFTEQVDRVDVGSWGVAITKAEKTA